MIERGTETNWRTGTNVYGLEAASTNSQVFVATWGVRIQSLPKQAKARRSHTYTYTFPQFPLFQTFAHLCKFMFMFMSTNTASFGFVS